MGRVERSRELARNRKRRQKLKKLRLAYAKAGSKGEKDIIAAKVRRISPFAVLEEASAS